MDAVSWSLPEAVGGGGDWVELEPEPELRSARLEGGLFPAARWTRFYVVCVCVCMCVCVCVCVQNIMQVIHMGEGILV